MLSVPKWLRYFMQRYGAVFNTVLRISLRVIGQGLQSNSPRAVSAHKARLHIGVVAFIHRFSSSLNENLNFHVCVGDRVFMEAACDRWAPRKRVLMVARSRRARP